MTRKPAIYGGITIGVSLVVGVLLLVAAGEIAPGLADRHPPQPAIKPLQRSADPAQVAEQLANLTAEIRRLEADTGNRLRDLEIRGLQVKVTGHASAATSEALSADSVHLVDPLATDETDSGIAVGNHAPSDAGIIRKIQDAMEARMVNEPFDARWAPGVQERLTSAIRQPEFSGSELIDLECRATLCRLGIQHASLEAEREFLHRFIGAAGLADAEAFYKRAERVNGGVTMTFYVSRDGGRLPGIAMSE